MLRKELYRGFIYKQVAVDRVLRTVVLILYEFKANTANRLRTCLTLTLTGASPYWMHLRRKIKVLVMSQKVDGYPSIVLYRDGQRQSDYLDPHAHGHP